MGVAEALRECTAALLRDDSTPDSSSPAALQVTRFELLVQLSCYAFTQGPWWQLVLSPLLCFPVSSAYLIMQGVHAIKFYASSE